MGVKLANDFLMGCDPEFVALAGGAHFRVSNILQADGAVGYDHGGRVGEIRPEPTKGTWALIRRIKKLITTHERALQLAAAADVWRAGAVVGPESLGGHIHFGDTNRSAFGQVPQQVTDALDALFQRFEALGVLPRADMERRRQNSQYGNYTSVDRVRLKDYGFEYRVPPSWLYDPKIAFLCLTAAKLAVVEPRVALADLRLRDTWAGFKALIEKFKGKDTNADRLLGMMSTAPMAGDPRANVLEVWKAAKI